MQSSVGHFAATAALTEGETPFLCHLQWPIANFPRTCTHRASSRKHFNFVSETRTQIFPSSLVLSFGNPPFLKWTVRSFRIANSIETIYSILIARLWYSLRLLLESFRQVNKSLNASAIPATRVGTQMIVIRSSGLCQWVVALQPPWCLVRGNNNNNLAALGEALCPSITKSIQHWSLRRPFSTINVGKNGHFGVVDRRCRSHLYVPMTRCSQWLSRERLIAPDFGWSATWFTAPRESHEREQCIRTHTQRDLFVILLALHVLHNFQPFNPISSRESLWISTFIWIFILILAVLSALLILNADCKMYTNTTRAHSKSANDTSECIHVRWNMHLCLR